MGAQQAKDSASGSSKRKSGDKKKINQNSKKDGELQNDSESLASTDNNQWLSEETMADSVADEDNDNLFVALYDFQSGGENQLDLLKGEKVIVLEYNENKEWSRVEKKNNSVSTRGWVPTNYIALASSNNKFFWFHGPLSRNAAEYLLSSGITGSFLVRESESCPGQMTISVRVEEKYLHYKIQRDFDMVYVAEEQQFASLDQLITFYSKEPGLMTLLQFPVRRVNKPAIFALSPEMEKWEVERSEIEMKQQLGSGQYGDVYEAMWKRHNLQVAVKTLRAESTALQEFMKEVTIMKEMKHQNLVQLLGICTWQPPYYIITEFMSQGNLLNYLRSSSPEELGPVILFYMATQIASAMVYLEKKNFIHRDLAARNCLVGEHHLVKVADFGLARLVVDDTYTAQTTCKFPIKWTAPEGLMYSSFSTKSDVWAFGVLLWELATYGETPYPSLELQNVYQFLDRGNRMPCPSGCPSFVYDLMLKCWKWEPAERPTFHEIHEILDMFQKSDIGEDVEKKLGESETNPDVMKTGATVVSGNNGRESASVAPPLGHVPKPSDFYPVKEARLPAAESGSRKPPAPPRKDVVRDHQVVREDGKDCRRSKKENVNNRIIGHQYSLDESRSDCQKTVINKAKSLPPKPAVNPAVLGAVAAGLRKTSDKEDALTPSFNDQPLNQLPSCLKQLPALPSAAATCETDRLGDAGGAKFRTMPHNRLGAAIVSSEITSQGKIVPKQKPYSASAACEAESNTEDSESTHLKQLTKRVALNFVENKSENSRTLLRQNTGDASGSCLSSHHQKALKGEGSALPPAVKPKPVTGPKPTVAKSHQQTIVTPF